MSTLYVQPMVQKIEIPEKYLKEICNDFQLNEIRHFPLHDSKLNRKKTYQLLFNRWTKLGPLYSDRVLATYWDPNHEFQEIGVPMQSVTGILHYWPFVVVCINENKDLKRIINEAKHEIAHTFIGQCRSAEPCISKCDLSEESMENDDFKPSSTELCEKCQSYVSYKQEMVGNFHVVNNDMDRIMTWINEAL